MPTNSGVEVGGAPFPGPPRPADGLGAGRGGRGGTARHERDGAHDRRSDPAHRDDHRQGARRVTTFVSAHPSPPPVTTPSCQTGAGYRSVDVVLEDPDELGDEAVAAQRAIEAAVDEDRGDRLLERARQRDPDVGVLALARAVDDAAHDRDAQLLGARVRLAPDRHLLLEVALDLLGHLLEEGRGRPAAAGTGRDLRQERAQPHRLEDLLGDLHLALARRAGLRRERDPDRVADALVEQDGEARRGRDDALVAHARLGQAEVERVVAASGQQPVDVDEVAHARDLGRR